MRTQEKTFFLQLSGIKMSCLLKICAKYSQSLRKNTGFGQSRHGKKADCTWLSICSISTYQTAFMKFIAYGNTWTTNSATYPKSNLSRAFPEKKLDSSTT